MDTIKNRRVEVLIGDFNSGIGDVISDCIQERTKDKYDLKISFSHIGEEILDLAQNSKIDIFILILNNIFRSSGKDQSLEDRLENSLQLSTQIKTTYGRPVIALSGWKEDTYVMRAKQAADFFFTLPLKIGPLVDVFVKCLFMDRNFTDM